MANEIKITTSISYENGELKYSYQPGTAQISQATAGLASQIVSVTSAEAAVTLTGITNSAEMVIQSLVPTTTGATIVYSPETTTGGIGNPFAILRPKAVHVTALNSTTTLRFQNQSAAAGTNKVQLIVFEK